MGFHTFDAARADGLADPERFRYCSREELLGQLPNRPDRLLDLGSGIGFYTNELAPYADCVYAIDVQPAMHSAYLDRGVPGNVRLVTADAGRLPFVADWADAAVSTMTFHESATVAGLKDLNRVLDGPFVIVDWSGAGENEAGPPIEERFDAARARTLLERAGFDVRIATERVETFLAVADA